MNSANGNAMDSPLMCTACGKKIDTYHFNQDYYVYKYMAERHVCKDCAIWIEKIESRPEYTEIINHNYYNVYPYMSELLNYTLLKGKTRFILRSDNTISKSNNIVFVGQIPAHFWEFAKDTAVFISEPAYRNIKSKNGPLICQNKGCWDRHRCLWYAENMAPIEEFNKIPNTHQYGQECCPDFINKEEIYE